MTSDLYVRTVVDHIPHGLPLRDQIAMELRGHIAARVDAGQPLDDVLKQLGDPLTPAESYLAAAPLESARVGPRLAAKLIDGLLVVGASIAIGAMLMAVVPRNVSFFVPLVSPRMAVRQGFEPWVQV